ncbi:hypothetical protein CRG98_028834 [Punica granatum]|uniref:Uncharacterized protein n=1 Tax=Punica granatum TaxID=22663 RepID=A0A2I0J4D5_PUNGR|nr:hypothetical protein CRG98_028834 [Punica granatum]
MGITRSGRVYENSAVTDKGKAPAAETEVIPGVPCAPPKRVTEEEAEAFMKIIKASEYKVAELMAKSPAHISLLALLLSSEPHREALLRVLTAAQMNIDLNRVRPSKTAVRAFDGSRREVNGEIDLLIDVGPCSFSVTFQVLDIPNAFSLLLGKPWIHSADAIPSSLHQKLKFIVEERIITCLGEPRPVYFEEGFDEDSQVPEIEESLHRLEDRQFTSVEPMEEIHVGTENEPRTLKIGSGLNPTQRARMIDFLTRYQEVFACERGIEVDPDKVKAIKELPPPSSVREVRGFLGQLNYIARFIANLTNKCQPLFRLLRKNAAIKWNEECQKAFDTIKAYLVQPLVLVPPTPGRPLILYLTVRRQSLGCMLGQEEESTRTEHAIYYLSKKFTDGESNYSEIEKMCCVLVWVMQRLRQYTLYHTIRLLSKGQAIADHLAEFPIEDNTPIDPNFPDEGILQVDDEGEKPEWKMYFDGAVNSTGSGIGAVLISPDGRYYPVAAKIDFLCTNNVAEYEACILSLQAAIDFKWKTKDAKLVPYHEYLERLTENFEDISFTYTPRMNNQFADALTTLASMVSITKENLIEPLEIEITKGPAHCNVIEASEAKPWYEDIKNFLRTGQCPPFADRRD